MYFGRYFILVVVLIFLVNLYLVLFCVGNEEDLVFFIDLFGVFWGFFILDVDCEIVDIFVVLFFLVLFFCIDFGFGIVVEDFFVIVFFGFLSVDGNFSFEDLSELGIFFLCIGFNDVLFGIVIEEFFISVFLDFCCVDVRCEGLKDVRVVLCLLLWFFCIEVGSFNCLCFNLELILVNLELIYERV